MSPQLKKRTCYFCGKSFNRKFYRDHVAIHTLEKYYPCPVPNCVARFTGRNGLSAHKRQHDPTCRFSCALCSKMTKTKYNLFSHLNRVHLKEKWMKCKICGQTFCGSSSLQNHMTITHRTKEERRKFCTVEGCAKSFLDPAAFKTHVSYVHNNVNYPCNENGCGKVLSCKKSLSVHVTRVHKANLNLPCDQCNKKFKSLLALRGHVRDVHEKMGFVNCPKCNKSMRKSYIKKHLEIHKVKQERETFPCDQCKCLFYWKKLLRKHQRNEH